MPTRLQLSPEEKDSKNVPRILFARIGWMKRYDGSAKDDPGPIGGGSYNKEHKGSELYNFHNHQGWVYGFIQPAFQGRGKQRTLNLARIAPGQNEAELKNVLVIFVAKFDGEGPQVVVGWYRNATVFGTEGAELLHGRWRRYFARTKSGDAWLLKEETRKDFSVYSREIGMGQANISYVYGDDGEPRRLPGLHRILRRIGSTSLDDLLTLCKDCNSVRQKRKSRP